MQVRVLRACRPLCVSDAQGTDTGVKELQEALPNFHIQLAGLESLRTLGISGQKVTPRRVRRHCLKSN